jgi:hypothetical protein
VDAQSAQRQLQAQLTVTASTVTSVSLTAIGSAADLPTDPVASTTVAITAPPTPKKTSKTSSTSTAPPTPLTPQVPVSVTSRLPAGSLSGTPAKGPTLSPGGNAADLFPALDPKSTSNSAQSAKKAHTRPIANTTALPEGAPIAGAQLAGLAALALAFVLAVTRLSIRRRPASAKPSQETAAAADTPAKSPAQPEEQPDGTKAAQDTPATDEE